MGGGVREVDLSPKIYDLQKEFVLEKSQSQLVIFLPYCPRQQPPNGSPHTLFCIWSTNGKEMVRTL